MALAEASTSQLDPRRAILPDGASLVHRLRDEHPHAHQQPEPNGPFTAAELRATQVRRPPMLPAQHQGSGKLRLPSWNAVDPATSER